MRGSPQFACGAGGDESRASGPRVRQFCYDVSAPEVGGASKTRYRHRAFFVGSEMRRLAGSGRLKYVPISLEEVPLLLTSGRLPIDVALLQVSPPDARGFVSLGVSVDLAPAILSVARTVIAEVNPAMPRTHGESFVHVIRFDALVKVDAPMRNTFIRRSARLRNASPVILPRSLMMVRHFRSDLRLAARAQGTVTTSRDEDVVHVTVLFLFPDCISTNDARRPPSRRPASN
jgi:Acetyl-CoA hydrolase/transferase N-terminal domain